MQIGECSPLPASVSRVMASCPGSLLATCSDLCTSVEIVTASSFGVGPGCSVQQVRAWFTQCVAPPLDRARLLVATAGLTVHHVDPTTLRSGVLILWCAVGLLRQSNARFWGLLRWGHDPFSGGRSARHLGCDPSRVLCGAATGDLFHCLTVCLVFTDLRMQWCRRCSVPS